jgi:hypothetical protein
MKFLVASRHGSVIRGNRRAKTGRELEYEYGWCSLRSESLGALDQAPYPGLSEHPNWAARSRAAHFCYAALVAMTYEHPSR